ncbi:MAG: hypothetical protein CMJ94_11300 [Planctomycetes bacterium]|nr:hypothetical protein [Planctomycetota bacterium]
MKRPDSGGATQLLTTKQVAERFRCSARTVRAWCRAGHIKAVKIGNEYRISEEYLEWLIDGQPVRRGSGRQLLEWPDDRE